MKLKGYVIGSLMFGLLATPFGGGQFWGSAAAMAAEKTLETTELKVASLEVPKGADLDKLLRTQTANPEAVQKDAVKEQKTYNLKLNTKDYTKTSMQVDGQTVAFRVYADRVYVSRPIDAAYEKMTIYVPEAYFTGKSIQGYTAKTAPIFLPNGVGGYMPGEVLQPGADIRHGFEANAVLTALSKGYVVAAPAIRGRTLQAADGSYTGKAPALIVDYKAAVRYLRYNKDRLPAGDTEKIISNGTSAGGALSALLGATGNSKDYEPYLREIGAAEERDDIFASSDYCPITNLDHADMAYEWVFNGVDTYHQRKMGKMPPAGMRQGQPSAGSEKTDRPANAPAETDEAVTMSAVQSKASAALKALFPAYVNSLGLKDTKGNLLTLDAQGNGSFKTYLKSFYMASAQQALDRGEDLSKMNWLTIENGKVKDMDLAKYAIYATRMKAAPAFDALDNSTAENNEFGTKHSDNQHFTAFSQENSTVTADMADAHVIHLLNPMNYIGAEGVSTAKYWRIRHGAMDRDTSLAIPAILATRLMNHGYGVDFASPWNRGHDGDYDLNELFAWMDQICKEK